jgi:hypothetical protein
VGRSAAFCSPSNLSKGQTCLLCAEGNLRWLSKLRSCAFGLWTCARSSRSGVVLSLGTAEPCCNSPAWWGPQPVCFWPLCTARQGFGKFVLKSLLSHLFWAICRLWRLPAVLKCLTAVILIPASKRQYVQCCQAARQRLGCTGTSLTFCGRPTEPDLHQENLRPAHQHEELSLCYRFSIAF